MTGFTDNASIQALCNLRRLRRISDNRDSTRLLSVPLRTARSRSLKKIGNEVRHETNLLRNSFCRKRFHPARVGHLFL